MLILENCRDFRISSLSIYYTFIHYLFVRCFPSFLIGNTKILKKNIIYYNDDRNFFYLFIYLLFISGLFIIRFSFIYYYSS